MTAERTRVVIALADFALFFLHLPPSSRSPARYRYHTVRRILYFSPPGQFLRSTLGVLSARGPRPPRHHLAFYSDSVRQTTTVGDASSRQSVALSRSLHSPRSPLTLPCCPTSSLTIQVDGRANTHWRVQVHRGRHAADRDSQKSLTATRT